MLFYDDNTNDTGAIAIVAQAGFLLPNASSCIHRLKTEKHNNRVLS
jgi:hypothetical protein